MPGARRDRPAHGLPGRRPLPSAAAATLGHDTRTDGPHQVLVSAVSYLGEKQTATGDWWMAFQAPDGEVCEVRTSCGAYAPDQSWWTTEQARRHAIASLNELRMVVARS